MNNTTRQLVTSALKGDVMAFRQIVSNASDSEMIDALSTLWGEHNVELKKNEIALDLFLEMFNYQYNKYLISRPQLDEAKQSAQIRVTSSPINASVVRDVFKLARERQMLAY